MDRIFILLYGPTPEKAPWIPSVRINIGAISLAKSQRKIQLEIGTSRRHGARLLGLRHTFATTKGHSQWFRMDWHKPHGNEQHRLARYHYHW